MTRRHTKSMIVERHEAVVTLTIICSDIYEAILVRDDLIERLTEEGCVSLTLRGATKPHAEAPKTNAQG
jgi:hypothetical protein